MTNISYHSQTNKLLKRINQTIEIIFRFIIIENSNFNVVKILSTLQISLNNVFTTLIKYSSNELMYKFKMKNVLTILFVNACDMNAKSNMKFHTTEQFVKRRFMYIKKATNVTTFANAKSKAYYDKNHQSLLLQFEDEVYIKLHYEYKLLNILNKKLNNQQTNPFLMKWQIKR